MDHCELGFERGRCLAMKPSLGEVLLQQLGGEVVRALSPLYKGSCRAPMSGAWCQACRTTRADPDLTPGRTFFATRSITPFSSISATLHFFHLGDANSRSGP